MADRVLLDTSALIAGAGGDAKVAISVMTIAELRRDRGRLGMT